MRKIIIVSLAAFSLTLGACTPKPTATVSATLSVSPAALRTHIEYLADDDLRGRDTGSVEYQRSADYVANEFARIGLQPAGDTGSYFQEVPLVEEKLIEGSAAVTLHLPSGELKLQYPQQFMMGPDAVRASSAVTGEMVFVGYGIVAEEYGHDDYAGLDVAGKIVVALAGRPLGWPTEEGSHLGSGVEKARHAVERGAIGRISLHTPRQEATFPYADSLKYLHVPSMDWVAADGVPDGYQPQLQGGAFFNLDAAASLFAGSAVPLEDIFQADSDGMAVPRFALSGTASLSRQSSHRYFSSPNVVAVLEGSDPLLKNEYLIYSAHLDHLGVIANADGVEEIYNGAMDNAAGVATLLETARVLSAERAQLKRSVLFVIVTGEEKGLLGAGYFASNPTVPLQSLVANINLDMPLLLYPFADVVAFGAEHSDLKQYVERAANSAGVALAPDPMPEQGLFVRSDHYRFVQQGVPSVFLVTGFTSKNGQPSGGDVFSAFLKDHYHQPSDDTALPIDYETGAVFAEININIGREICNSPQRPRWNEGDFFGRTFAGGLQ